MRGFARMWIVLASVAALCGLVAPAGTAATTPYYSQVPIVSDGSGRPVDVPSTPGTTHIVVPGTDDADGADQFGRMQNWFAGGERVLIVNYPATIGPSIGGLQAPGYDSLRDAGVLGTLVAVRDADGHVTIYGYSQGAETAGNAAELIHLLGLKPDEDVSLVLWADPRFPETGLKEQLKNNHPIVSAILAAVFDVETNGQRDPANTGEIQVTSIAIIGDPVTGLETWYLNPVGFVVNGVSGFFMIHSGLGEQSANNLNELEVLKTWQDGNTTYVVYDAEHPMVQLLRYIGVPVCEPGIRFWEFIAPRTVPGQDPAHAPGLADWISYVSTEIEIASQELSVSTPTSASVHAEAPAQSTVVSESPREEDDDTPPQLAEVPLQQETVTIPDDEVSATTEEESSDATDSRTPSVESSTGASETTTPADAGADDSTPADPTLATSDDPSPVGVDSVLDAA